MGITGKRAKTESLSPAERKVLKSDSEGRPGASGRDSGGYLPLSGFSKRPLLRQFGWYHGDVFVPMSFYGRDGGFFYFPMLYIQKFLLRSAGASPRPTVKEFPP